MPPAQRKRPEVDLQSILEATREDISAMRATIDRMVATTPVPLHDEDGYVVGHSAYVDETSIRWGDVIASANPKPYPPMILRCKQPGSPGRRFVLRTENGMVDDGDHVPKPWRLLWRDPAEWARIEQPKKDEAPRRRGRRRAADDGDDG